MKKLKQITVMAVILVLLMAPTAAKAKPDGIPLLDDKLVFGGTFTLESGETLNGDLVIFGGVVNLLEGSTVTGEVVLFGGNLTVEGTINKNVFAFGGVVELGETAIVRGDLIAPGTVLRREDGAMIGGDLITDGQPLNIEIPDIPDVPEVPEIPQPIRPSFGDQFFRAIAPVTQVFWFMFRTFAFSAAAVLVMLIVPKQTLRASGTVVREPVVSGGLGILTITAVFILTVVYTVSMVLVLPILLLPVVLLVWLVLGVGLIFGWIAVGHELGRRIGESIDRTWTPELQAGIGVFALTFLIGSFNIVLWDWIGSVLVAVVGSIGLGSVLLTRFGSREYVPASAGGAGGLVEAPEPKSPVEIEGAKAKPKAQPKAKAKAKTKTKSKTSRKTSEKGNRETGKYNKQERG